MKFNLIFLCLLLSFNSLAATQPTWILGDLSKIPELSDFFGGADAILTLPEEKNAPNAIRPTVVIYKLKETSVPDSIEQWRKLVKTNIKNRKIIGLSESLTDGKYVYEFTSSANDDGTDMKSIYMAQKIGNSIHLFVFDGVGSSTAKNMPLVKALYKNMDAKMLAKMYLMPKK